MKSWRAAILVGIFIWSAWAATGRAAAVRVAEGKIELPTYVLGDEDPNPPFTLLTGHAIYPYTMLDDLTHRLEKKNYKTVFLENEFLKAIVLPELGGRLYSLYDKATGREVFYRNHVVKYGLVALRGAWVSGGIEFNFPDGHTVVTVSPVAFALRQQADGSATVTVGDIDQVTGMHWEVGLTMRPGEARLEQRVTLFNSTPVNNLYWYWANAAVPATEDMTFVYPMREAYPHARWPVYTFPDYQGVNYSAYKDIRQPTSLFGRQVHRNFFGAYYAKADYGVVHWADFREVPGKKVWTWGVAGDGLIWTDLLTDGDGPYNEIQSGRYETQLNYEFMSPRRVESWTEYWYPVRGLGGYFIEATSEFALSARFIPQAGPEPRTFRIAISPAIALEGIKVRLYEGTRTVREFGPVSLKPLAPESFDIPVKDLHPDAKLPLTANLSIEVLSSAGRPLIRWVSQDPVDGNADFVPAAGAPEPQPKALDQMSIQELYLRGVELEKVKAEQAAREIFDKVLERDPGHIPALLEKAWWHYRAADLPGAEAFIRRALARDSHNPQAQYAAGVVYRASGRPSAAADAFWEAIHFGGAPAPAFAQLGEIAIQQKDYDEAAKLLRQALGFNRDDALALTALAVALRLAGKIDVAAKAVDAALQKMPLLPYALAERRIIADSEKPQRSSSPTPNPPAPHLLKDDAELSLDVAAWYLDLGDWPSAIDVLTPVSGGPNPIAVSPLVDYYLAAIFERRGQRERANMQLNLAETRSLKFIFPHRVADAQILAECGLRKPLDARAQYLLGNFLFERGRYDDAATLWFQALGEGFDDAALERNLGVHAWRVKKDTKAAAGYYAKAIQLSPSDYRLYRDLDEIDFQMGDISHRADLFARAPAAVLDRDSIRVRRALLFVQQKHFDDALAVFEGHPFRPWEGGEIIRQIFVFANLEKGRKNLEAKEFKLAEQAFRRALEYPPNLGVGKPYRPHDEEALYWLGRALQAEENTEEARSAWQEAVKEGAERGQSSRVYAALALGRLGKNEEAEKIFDDLARAASRDSVSPSAYFVAGLAEQARQHPEPARAFFRRALELDPGLWMARFELERTYAR